MDVEESGNEILFDWVRKELKYWSGRADLNGRPPAPKAGALTRLRYAPTSKR
jgi:hypothetical protein